MKKILFFKPFQFILILCFILLSPFSLLLSSAQPYTVYECNFDNWTDGKPDGWSFADPGITTVSQYTPAFSGLYSCKVEGGRRTPFSYIVEMTGTETFPMYYEKKYVLSFTVKTIKDTRFVISIINPSGYSSIQHYFFERIVAEDNVWKNYEIEFVSNCRHGWSMSNIPYFPMSNLLNVLRIEASYPRQGSEGVEFIIDNIKLVAKDHTMEFDYLETNNLKTHIDPIVPFLGGQYNCNWYGDCVPSGNFNYFEAPKNSKKSTIFTSNLWLGCTDAAQQLYVAAHTYTQRGRDFWLGPVTNDFDSVYDSFLQKTIKAPTDAYRQKYHHTWKVSKAEIEYHKAQYANPSYVMPWAIANWPAHGRAEYGESAELAPYKKVSKSDTYNPAFGDYPLIRGDEAVFFMTNDAFDAHTESGGTPLKVDILGMAYAFNSSDPALQNTIFLSYDIRNRSNINYKDFYFGFFTDFDIGYANDDYIGCDTSLNLMYGYNGFEIDGNGQIWAYGENPPAQGAMFLNQKMSAFVYHNNNNSPTGDPRYAVEYYNMLRAIWKDGMPVTYGGNGYNPGSTDYTNFMFSGDPINKTGWTEFTPDPGVPGSLPNAPDDRRGMMSAGPFDLPAGGKLTVDVALPFARDYGSKNGNLASLALLKQFAAEIQEYFEGNILGIVETGRAPSLRVYPNPSNGQFTIESEKIIELIEVYDLLGKKVFTGAPKTETTQINTQLPKGLYIYRAVLEDRSVCSGKIVVQ